MRILGSLLGCVFLLSTCTPTKPAEGGSGKADTNTCSASESWITNPTMPSEVAPTESFCDFYQFSWQWLLAQVSPSNPAAPNGERVFETNRVLDPNVPAGQCALNALSGRATAAKLVAPRTIKPKDFEQVQADGKALYDQKGNILYYNVWYSQAECSSPTASGGFAPGTFEIKVAWRILPAPDPTYFMMKALIPSAAGVAPDKEVTLGLVGFHLANWTSKHPEMIWATFEHKTNAPLCNGSSVTPTSGWSLTSGPAAQCLNSSAQAGSGPPSPNCASFNFNTANSFSGNPPPTATPNQICRQYENGNQPGTSVNGNDNTANLLAIQQLNAQLVGTQGLLTALPDTNPMAVWKNYEMVGGLWTKGGVSSCSPNSKVCNEPVPYTVAGKLVAPSADSPQRGSLELTNMTMETFEQGDTSEVPNCFGCHNYSSSSPLKVSHIARKLFPPSVAIAP
jgi:hypothetical protein